MSRRMDRLARSIKGFVENPVTNLVKGITLLAIGLADASHTLRNDITQGRVRLGHGLILIGVFGILGTLPQFVEGLEAGERFLEIRAAKDRASTGEERP